MLALVAALIVGGWLYRYVMLPEARLRARIVTAQQQLTHLPGYRLLPQQEPARWRQLNAKLAVQLRAGASDAQAMGDVRAMLPKLLNCLIA